MLNIYVKNKCYLCFIFPPTLLNVVKNYKMKENQLYKFQNY